MAAGRRAGAKERGAYGPQPQPRRSRQTKAPRRVLCSKRAASERAGSLAARYPDGVRLTPTCWRLTAEGDEGVVAAVVGLLGLGRVAIDHEAAVHGVVQAAHLVLQRVQVLPRVGVYDVFEPELVVARLLHDEVALLQEVI